MRILLVEDDVDLAEVMQLLLTDAGAHVQVAHSFNEVIAQRAEVLASELAVLDVNLGDARASGIQVHAWLREQGFAGRVVFLTGHARSHPLVAEAERVGGARILSKPIAVGELERLVAGGP